MRFLSVLCYIITFAVFVFLVLLPTISTWSAVFDNTVGGILFSIFLFWFATLAYPIALLLGGLATGLGGTVSFIALAIGYVFIGVTIGLFILSGWLWEKADEAANQKAWIKMQMESNQRNLAPPIYPSQPLIPSQTYTGVQNNQAPLSTPQTDEPSYIGNMRTRTLHVFDCPQVGQFDLAKHQRFYSINDANNYGYKPCKLCSPELYLYRKWREKEKL
jgi:hypothetical protein